MTGFYSAPDFACVKASFLGERPTAPAGEANRGFDGAAVGADGALQNASRRDPRILGDQVLAGRWWNEPTMTRFARLSNSSD